MSDQILLSICIPTYNRSSYLKKCLTSIVNQLSEAKNRVSVELIISDNYSTDDTGSVVKFFQELHPHINYYRNIKNLGFDRNVYQVITKAHGEYLWLLNDVVILKPGSINYLLERIKERNEVGFICISQSTTNIIIDDEIRVFKDGNQWLNEIGLVGGRISQCVFNRRYIPQNITKYFGNLWLHYSIALEIMSKHQAILIKNLFLDQDNKMPRRWENGETPLTIYVCLINVIRYLSNLGYDNKIISHVIKGLQRGIPRIVASARLHGLNIDCHGFRQITRGFSNYFSVYFIVSLFVFVTPVVALRKLKSLLS